MSIKAYQSYVAKKYHFTIIVLLQYQGSIILRKGKGNISLKQLYATIPFPYHISTRFVITFLKCHIKHLYDLKQRRVEIKLI